MISTTYTTDIFHLAQFKTLSSNKVFFLFIYLFIIFLLFFCKFSDTH